MSTTALALFETGLPMRDLLTLLAVALVAAFARGFSGFGGALIFVPLASAVIGPKLTSALLLIIDGITTLGLAPMAWRSADRREVGLMAAGSIIGIPAGTYVLAHADPVAIRWAVVALVVSLLALLVSGWRYAGRPRPAFTIGVGTLAGVFSGTAQIGGPPVVAYWLGGPLPGAIVRANVLLYFMASSLVTVASYMVGGLFVARLLPLALMVGPAYGLGLYLGSRLFGLADDRYFRKICYLMIVLAAIIGLPILDPYLR